MASTGEVWRLGHRPALDGLRGLAILLVLACHFEIPGMYSAGPTGVTIFFTLSGFLITSLLLEEHAASQRIKLGAFFVRRVRRLAPAAAVCIVTITAVGFYLPGFAPTPMLLGALTYSLNWVIVWSNVEPGAFAHMWSLAIEEQFYLLWPLLAIGLLRISRKVATAALSLAVTVSAFIPVAHFGDWDRMYYGTDSRIDALLIGCLLAFLMHRRPARRVSAWCVAPLVVAVVAIPYVPLPFVFSLSPLLVAAATAVLIYGSTQQAASWLAWKPLALIGQRSYGLYLWHWPIVVLVQRLLDPGWVTLVVVGLPVSAVVTALSWRFVEAPFLRPRKALGPRGRLGPDRHVAEPCVSGARL